MPTLRHGPARLQPAAPPSCSAKFAVVTTDRVVHLYDGEKGEKKDKFRTKPNDPSFTNYVVRAMAFSPDGTKLAVCQSDEMVFLYK